METTNIINVVKGANKRSKYTVFGFVRSYNENEIPSIPSLIIYIIIYYYFIKILYMIIFHQYIDGHLNYKY